jgi:hypothetical protein
MPNILSQQNTNTRAKVQVFECKTIKINMFIHSRWRPKLSRPEPSVLIMIFSKLASEICKKNHPFCQLICIGMAFC